MEFMPGGPAKNGDARGGEVRQVDPGARVALEVLEKGVREVRACEADRAWQ